MSPFLLCLLVPLGALLIWGFTKHQLNSVFGISSAIATVLSIWLLLYLVFSYEPPVENPFASVEEIMKENGNWKVRYIVKNIGYIIGAVYFFLCWFIGNKILSNEKT